MKKLIRYFALLFVVGLIWAQNNNPRDIPLFGGDDNPQHDGQPQFCQARDENGFKKNCGVCDMTCPKPGEEQQELPKCKTYCRKGQCKCAVCKMTKMQMSKDPKNNTVAMNK